jgi:hypothetical protein
VQQACSAARHSQRMRIKDCDSSKTNGWGCEVDGIIHTAELATLGAWMVHVVSVAATWQASGWIK